MTVNSTNNLYDYSSYNLNTQINPIDPKSVETKSAQETTPETKPEIPSKEPALSKEESIALYYNYQATQLTKDIFNIYATGSTEEETTSVDFSDINSLHKQMNKTAVLDELASKPQDERPEDIDYKDYLDLEDKKDLASNVSKEESVALYYNHQATQLTKDIVNIYAQGKPEDESASLDFKDINELQKQVNRGSILDLEAQK